ncbi:MAG: hypothetical protein ABI779_07915 [Acidobacteriota bacterium]
MTPGKRNIEGITFQVLRTAQWALWIHIAPSTTSANAVRITAEPLGGDVQVEGTGPLIVQQFKTRDGNRTWSLREIVNEVLPDLYLAVPKSLDQPVRYQFVTNGRMGSWREAQTFFASLADRPIPPGPLARLDDKTPVRFFGRGLCTRRALFAEICDAVRAHGEVKKLKDTVLQTRKKVWHLLGRLSFVQTLGVEESRAALREMLRTFAPSDKEAEKLVHEVTGRVLDLSRKPDSTFSPQQLLLGLGIDVDRFAGVHPFREAMRRRAAENAARLVKYRPELAVRRRIAAPTKRFAAFRGVSGTGKSWELATLAHKLGDAADGPLPVFLRVSNDVRADVEKAAVAFVHDLLAEAAADALDARARVRDRVPDLGGDWLMTCLDDVRTIEQIHELAALPLESWGIRVAITVPDNAATVAALADIGVEVVDVGDFDEDELAEFLTRHRRNTRAPRLDMLDVMRRPLHAELYVHASSESWQPSNEYLLYDACWNRIAPADARALLRLVRAMLDGAPYPWTNDVIDSVGATVAELERLEVAGWVLQGADGVAIWHERLLNWAVAETVADEHRRSGADPGALAAQIEFFARSAGESKGPFGYVPMDLVWLAIHRLAFTPDETGEMLQEIENRHVFQRDIYHDDLLSSLDMTIAQPLLVHARLAEESGDRFGVELQVWRTCRQLLGKHRTEAEGFIAGALASESTIVKGIGVRLAVDFPHGSFAPALWRVKCDWDATPEKEGEDLDTGIAMENQELHFARWRVTAALSAAVQRNSGWLRDEIRAQAANQETLIKLLWTLSELDGGTERDLWLELKVEVLASVPADEDGSAALIACIDNAGDGEEVPRLRELARHQSRSVAGSALSALAALNPDIAIIEMEVISIEVLAWTGWRLFPRLMFEREEATAAALRMKAAGDLTAVPRLADLFSTLQVRLDGETAKLFAEWLESRIGAFLQNPEGVKIVWLHSVLRLLSAAGRPDVLAALAERPALGLRLSELYVALSTVKGSEAAVVRATLPQLIRRTGAGAFTNYVTRAILSSGKLPREFIIWCVAVRDSETVHEALYAHLENASGASRRIAVAALAAMGDDAAMVRGVMEGSGGEIRDTLIDDYPPAGDDVLAEALAALDATNVDQRTRAIMAVGFSRRADLFPRVTAVAAAATLGSALRRAAVSAAARLMPPGAPVESMLGSVDDSGDLREVIVWMLRRSGSTAALDRAEEHVCTYAFHPLSDPERFAWLLGDDERGRRVGMWLLERIADLPFRYWRDEWIEYVLPLGAAAAFRRRALRESRPDQEEPLQAIRALEHFDRGAAFDAAADLLRSHERGREATVAKLITFDEERALPLLVGHFTEEPSAAVRWTIGRHLRVANDQHRVRTLVEDLLNSGDSDRRAAGCDLAGWLPCVPEWTLKNLARTSTSSRVKRRALDAWQRRRQLDVTARLRSALQVASGFEMWTLTEALIRTGDAEILESERDPLSILPFVDAFPAALRELAVSWLKEQRKENASEARSEDRRQSPV